MSDLGLGIRTGQVKLTSDLSKSPLSGFERSLTQGRVADSLTWAEELLKEAALHSLLDDCAMAARLPDEREGQITKAS